MAVDLKPKGFFSFSEIIVRGHPLMEAKQQAVLASLRLNFLQSFPRQNEESGGASLLSLSRILTIWGRL